ncbi:MAG: NUDIX domain-containing protein [Pseudomonadota bacterium]|nr:NUDIX domain-containing protein [Pseudomonadota bacterium]
MPKPPPPQLVKRIAASIAVFRDGQVLLAQRSKPGSHGLWSLPGGHIEDGEAAIDTARRELAEETGVTARVLGIVDRIDIVATTAATGGSDVTYELTVFYGLWESGEGEARSDCMGVRWEHPGRLGGLQMTPGTAKVIGKAAEMAAGATSQEPSGD